MKLRPKTIWRIRLITLLVVLLLSFSVPWRRVWQRVKVPVLVQCVRHGPEATRRYAAIFLAHSDGDKKMIASVLLPGLKDKDEGVREMTAIALGDIHQEPELVVPALFACIDTETNPASLVPNYALSAIGRFGTNARPWSPILVGMIESNRFHYWLNPLGALKNIDPETAKPLIEKRDANYSNGVKQAQAHFDEVARRRALFLRTNVPPTNSTASTNATLANPHP
jgi:HEAT repeat protein